MATNIMSSDIFLASKFIEKLKQRYIDISEDTLLLGMYGYLSTIFSNLIQNTTILASDYAMEAIPTRAKFDKNVIAHALALGIKKINAVPASINVLLGFSQDALDNNMQRINDKKSRLILEKDFVFTIGDRELYPYCLDYNVEIQRIELPDGRTTYTAMYMIDNTNPLLSLSNPYLPEMGIINAEGQNLIALQVTLRQMTHTVIHYKLNVDNPLELKTKEFSFENQLAYFYVEVIEEKNNKTSTHYLIPVYEGLYTYDLTDKEYINYMYLDEQTIRLKFSRESYNPTRNCEINIHIYTTLGSKCNIYLDDTFQVYREISSETYSYSGLYVLIRSNSSSIFGEDKASIEQLQHLIPREMVARGSYCTYSDLQTFFNLIQSDDCKMTLFQRVYNQLENIYFAYILIKYNGNVIPTNTIDLEFNRDQVDHVSRNNFVLDPNATFYLPKDSKTATLVPRNLTPMEIDNYEQNGFLYSCPFLMVINKTPFYVSYYNIFPKYERILYFEYINAESVVQFIAEKFKVYRDMFNTPSNEFHLQVQCMQNINTDYDLLVFNEANELIECNIKAYIVFYLYDKDGVKHPARYITGELINYNSNALVYTFDFKITTSNVMAETKPHMLFETGLKLIGYEKESPLYLPNNVEMKLFLFFKGTQEYGRLYGDKLEFSADDYFPELEGWSLTNIYSTKETGVDLFYDYSDLMTSYIKLQKSDTALTYWAGKVPVIKRTWLNNVDQTTDQAETKVQYFFQMLDYRRRYIQDALILIENPFAINFKFYNTYGPSMNYMVAKNTRLDKVNITLKFEIMFVTKEDQVILPEIKETIKGYIEEINNTSDLHFPNLITYITNLYRDSIVYFKFVQLDGYQTLWQSIYKSQIVLDSAWEESQRVPEFINVNLLSNGLPDIEFDIVS